MVHVFYIAHLRDVLLVKTTTIRHARVDLVVEHEDVIIGDNLRCKLKQDLDVCSGVNNVVQTIFEERV